MELHQVADDREPKAQSAVPSRRARVGLAKSLEDMRQEIGRYARTVVLHRDLELAVGSMDSYFHSSRPGGRELDRVREDVPHDLLEADWIAQDGRCRGPVRPLQRDAAGLGIGA